jgi:16S rRNA (cytidine1402-2'-O)-methyltransferase
LPTHRFLFDGFLSRRRGERIRALEALRQERGTLVFFESPRRLADSLADMATVLGDREAVVAREVTKAFEEIRRGTLASLEAWARQGEVLGEVTILVAGQGQEGDPDLRALASRIRFLRARCGLADREVVRVVHQETGVPSKEIYRILLMAEEAPES